MPNDGDFAGSEVRLSLPAEPLYLRLARLTAAGLASRLGFTYDEVEDLRIAIDELCFAMVGAAGRPGTITLRYVVVDRGLTVEGEGAFGDDRGRAPAITDLSRLILDATVDEHDVAAGATGPTFRLLKRHGGS